MTWNSFCFKVGLYCKSVHILGMGYIEKWAVYLKTIMLFFYLVIQDLDISLKEIIWNVRKSVHANQTDTFTKLFKLQNIQKQSKRWPRCKIRRKQQMSLKWRENKMVEKWWYRSPDVKRKFEKFMWNDLTTVLEHGNWTKRKHPGDPGVWLRLYPCYMKMGKH